MENPGEKNLNGNVVKIGVKLHATCKGRTINRREIMLSVARPIVGEPNKSKMRNNIAQKAKYFH